MLDGSGDVLRSESSVEVETSGMVVKSRSDLRFALCVEEVDGSLAPSGFKVVRTSSVLVAFKLLAVVLLRLFLWVACLRACKSELGVESSYCHHYLYGESTVSPSSARLSITETAKEERSVYDP